MAVKWGFASFTLGPPENYKRVYMCLDESQKFVDLLVEDVHGAKAVIASFYRNEGGSVQRTAKFISMRRYLADREALADIVRIKFNAEVIFDDT